MALTWLLANPDASARVFQAERHILLEEPLMEMLHEGIHEHDAECVVEREKRTKKIGLIPCPAFVYPNLRILEGIGDIVEMDVNVFTQSWKYFE